MRLGDLAGKEVINIFDGMRLGEIGELDLLIDDESGAIDSIILPQRSNLFNLWLDRREMVIPWDAVKKIGSEVIVVELDQTYPNRR